MLALTLSVLLALLSGLRLPSGGGVIGVGEPWKRDSGPEGVSPPPEVASPGEWQGIVAGLREQVAASPHDRDLRVSLALALRASGQLEEAEDAYRALLAEGEDAFLRVRLGNVLRDRGELGAAEEAYRDALAGDPTVVTAYLNLAELLWRLGRPDEGLDLLAKGRGQVAPEAAPRLEEAARALGEGLSPTETAE